MAQITRERQVIDSKWVRSQFPSLALEQDGKPVVYLDNPAGTQVPRQCIDAISRYLQEANSNVHGAFLTSRRTDAILDTARESMAAFLGASSPREIAFGPNMTSLTFTLSRAIGRTLGPGDEVLVTELDHDANVTPWLDLQERGVTVRRVPVHLTDCTLDMEALASMLNHRTRLVAVTYASNAVGTVTDVRKIAEMAHSAGALLWVDAVHYGPHGPIDVQELDVDFLVCSSYKFFGPHLGILYGKLALLDELRPYQLRPAPHTAPEKFESGTKNHECLAGLVATLDYLAELGRTGSGEPGAEPKRDSLRRAMNSIRDYEQGLSAAMLEGLQSVPGLKVYGITDTARLAERVPTFAFTIDGHATEEIGAALGASGIFAWTGNYYALDIMEKLGLEGRGGAVRVGAVHYNRVDEIERLVVALRR
ncbi:MAG: cysteine desulfurase-like protein, partial [Chloroflexota bacterium]|nr:cysteine desulfurase-like protein [Chloroflexota bacterium]